MTTRADEIRGTLTRDVVSRAMRAGMEHGIDAAIEHLIAALTARPDKPHNHPDDPEGYWRCGCGQLNNDARKFCGNCDSSIEDKEDPLFGPSAKAKRALTARPEAVCTYCGHPRSAHTYDTSRCPDGKGGWQGASGFCPVKEDAPRPEADLRAALTDSVLERVGAAYNEPLRLKRNRHAAMRDVLVAALTEGATEPYTKIGESLGLSENLHVIPKQPASLRSSEAGAPAPREQLIGWAARLVRLVCFIDLDRNPDENVAEPIRRIALEMRDAAERAATGTGAWQDIATAPKDGTDVAIYIPAESDDPCEVVNAHWSITEGRWVDARSGWILESPSPTHWQPLPPAPTTARG